MSSEPSSSTTRAAAHRYYPALAALLLAAAAVRVVFLGSREMWLDECHSVMTAISPEGVLAELQQDTNPPLYFLLLRLWTALGGLEPIWVRGLSALAGVLGVAAFGWMLREFGASRRAVLWGVGLMGGAALHVHYSQEARSYTLLLLLLTSAAACAARALGHHPRRPTRMTAAFLLLAVVLQWLAVCTHYLALLFVASLTVALAVWRPRKRELSALIVAQVVLAAAVAPLAARAVRQSQVEGLAFLNAFWESEPLWRLLARSLSTISVGGYQGVYLLAPSPSQTTVILSGIVFGVLALLALGLALSRGADARYDGTARTRLVARPLVVLALGPILLLIAASFAGRPMFLPGRYDLLAMPGWLGLAAVALDWLQSLPRVRDRVVAQALPCLLIAMLALNGLAVRWRWFSAPPAFRVQEERVDLLRTASPNDLAAGLAQESLKTGYALARAGVTLPLATFPTGTRRHWGWYLPDEVAARGEAALREDAAHLTTLLFLSGGQRLWVLRDPASMVAPPENGAPLPAPVFIAETLRASLEERGFARVTTGTVTLEMQDAAALEVWDAPPVDSLTTATAAR